MAAAAQRSLRNSSGGGSRRRGGRGGWQQRMAAAERARRPRAPALPLPPQVLFLLYHYFNAKEIYNAIRVFIAAYVWMTGFGGWVLQPSGCSCRGTRRGARRQRFQLGAAGVPARPAGACPPARPPLTRPLAPFVAGRQLLLLLPHRRLWHWAVQPDDVAPQLPGPLLLPGARPREGRRGAAARPALRRTRVCL